MIHLHDFATQQGVTDRAIQKHLKTYAAELEGLYERKGPNGTWLTDEAVEFLRSKMKQAPIVVGDSQIYQEKAEVEAENKALLQELKEAYKEIAELRPAQALLEAAQRETLLLEEAKEEQTKKIDDLTRENAVLSHEVVEWKDKATQFKENAQNLNTELSAANQYASDLEEWTNLPWLKRIRTPKPIRSKE